MILQRAVHGGRFGAGLLLRWFPGTNERPLRDAQMAASGDGVPGTFMLLVDVTIVNIALPGMAADLHTSFSALQGVVDGYALALAALLLGVGTVADRVGHRRTYLTGLVVFALSSLCCGPAPVPPSWWWRAACRGRGRRRCSPPRSR